MLSDAHRQFLKTLGNPGRVEVMLLLLTRPLNVTDLAHKSGWPRAPSHHLKRLRLCSFVTAARNGKERMYSVNEETVGPLFRLMDRHVRKYCRRLCCQRPRAH